LVPPESGEKGYQNNSVIKNRFEKEREDNFLVTKQKNLPLSREKSSAPET
jgi:hypothetical protein